MNSSHLSFSRVLNGRSGILKSISFEQPVIRIRTISGTGEDVSASSGYVSLNPHNQLNTGMVKDIFISYARKDLARVEPIVTALEQHGWRPIIDRKAFLPGVTWPDEIQRSLDSSRCVLVVWTCESVDLKNHEWVKREAGAGKEKGILVPVRLDVVDPPSAFEKVHFADLSGWNSDCSHPEFLKCIEAIKSRFPVQNIIDILENENPDDFGTVLEYAAELQFEGAHSQLFIQLQDEYLKKIPEKGKIEWGTRLKMLLKLHKENKVKQESGKTKTISYTTVDNGQQSVQYVTNDFKLWHGLDKKRLKEDFKRLRRDSNLLKVIFIEYNDEALSRDVPDILLSDYKNKFSSDVTKIKGNINDDYFYLSGDDGIEEDWQDCFRKIFGLSGSISEIREKFIKENRQKETHFIVQEIKQFKFDKFEAYYLLWESLHLEKPLFLFFHVDENVLPSKPARSNYLFCRNRRTESVDYHDFDSFFKKHTDRYRPDPALLKSGSPKMCFRDAVDKLETLELSKK